MKIVKRSRGTACAAAVVLVCAMAMMLGVGPAIATQGAGTATTRATAIMVPFAAIASGKTSQIREPVRLVVRSQETWGELWRRHTLRAVSPPPVDFSREMVVAIFLGPASPSTTVAVARIVRDSAHLTVLYARTETRPRPDLADASIAPFVIVRLARAPTPVKFILIKTPPVLAPGPD